MLARRCRGKSGAFGAACVPLLLALAVLALSASGPVAAYDDAQCESHVYPLDGSTLKPVRWDFSFFNSKAPLASFPSLSRRNLAIGQKKKKKTDMHYGTRSPRNPLSDAGSFSLECRASPRKLVDNEKTPHFPRKSAILWGA